MDNSSNSSVNPKVPDFSRAKKENKFLKIFIPILIVLLVAGGVVATLFITGVIGGNGNGPEDTVDIDIEDKAVVSKINDELSLLFGGSIENSEIVINSSNYDDVSLWKDLDLSEEQKIYRILNSLDESQKLELDEVQREVATSAWIENGGAQEALNFDTVVAFSGETVGEKYKSVFGTNVGTMPLKSSRVQYLPSYDIYFKVPSNETPTANERHYYIGRYFENNGRAYVYISGGLYNTDSRTAYCDVFTPDKTDVETCENVAEGQTFNIVNENSGYYLLRMFTFYLGENGNVYFLGSQSPITEWGIDPDAE